jgi:MOSC domain-containing protein YiiM
MLSPHAPPTILYSIQVGTPSSCGFADAIDAREKPWTTGFFKTPVNGPMFVGATNLDGDGQPDLKSHGGIDKAVLAYSLDHSAKWRHELQMPDMTCGAFGENLPIAGWNEKSVYIGDIFRIATLTFEVSKPRQPCGKLASCWRIDELTGLLVRNGRRGWYLRLREQGWIEARMPVVLIKCPNPAWSIARANEILRRRKMDLPLTLELAGVRALADSWVEEWRARRPFARAERTGIVSRFLLPPESEFRDLRP